MSPPPASGDFSSHPGQNFQLGGHNTLIKDVNIWWTITNRPSDIDILVKHTSSVVQKFPTSPGKHLTFQPLNGVTGHPCHGLPYWQFSCQFSAETDRRTYGHTDGQRDNGHQYIMPPPIGAATLKTIDIIHVNVCLWCSLFFKHCIMIIQAVQLTLID